MALQLSTRRTTGAHNMGTSDAWGLEDVEREVLTEIEETGQMKISEVAETFDLSHERARSIMNSLSNKNRVVSAPGFQYEPATEQDRE